MPCNERFDKFGNGSLQLELFNLVLATILVVLDVVWRQADLRYMPVSRIFIRLNILVIIAVFIFAQHQIDCRV